MFTTGVTYKIPCLPTCWATGSKMLSIVFVWKTGMLTTCDNTVKETNLAYSAVQTVKCEQFHNNAYKWQKLEAYVVRTHTLTAAAQRALPTHGAYSAHWQPAPQLSIKQPSLVFRRTRLPPFRAEIPLFCSLQLMRCLSARRRRRSSSSSSSGGVYVGCTGAEWRRSYRLRAWSSVTMNPSNESGVVCTLRRLLRPHYAACPSVCISGVRPVESHRARAAGIIDVPIFSSKVQINDIGRQRPPEWWIKATQTCNRQTDGQTDGRTDGQYPYCGLLWPTVTQ